MALPPRSRAGAEPYWGTQGQSIVQKAGLELGKKAGAMGCQACEHCSGRKPPLLFPAVIQVHPHPSLNTETLTLREDVKGFTSIPDADFPIMLGNLSITLARAQLAQGIGPTPSEHTRCVGSAQRQTDDLSLWNNSLGTLRLTEPLLAGRRASGSVHLPNFLPP